MGISQTKRAKKQASPTARYSYSRRERYTRAAPTTEGSTLRRDMLNSSVVKNVKSSRSTGVGDMAAVSHDHRG